MPLTRYERGVIEDIINKVIKQQESIDFLIAEISRLSEAVEKLGGNNLLNLSTEEIIDIIEDAVRAIIKKALVKKHTHLTDLEGGPAFAEKGANLIE